jgi:hypothetical protein
MPLFLRLSETHVLPVMLRHVGAPLAYYVTVVGMQDEVTHLWGYDSVGDMETRRIARNQDPEWPRYAVDSRDLIDVQETRVVRRLALASLVGAPAPDPAKALVELKVTSIRRGTMPDFLRCFEDIALPVLRRHAGTPTGLYLAEIGPQNQLTQLWAFASLADYEARTAARDREPAWAQFQADTQSMVQGETTKIARRMTFGGAPQS